MRFYILHFGHVDTEDLDPPVLELYDDVEEAARALWKFLDDRCCDLTEESVLEVARTTLKKKGDEMYFNSDDFGDPEKDDGLWIGGITVAR